ncbi:uncharacterized protein LOC141829209 [Curcuma longa]|uniref:uncharacterized protein LOC141829209 n=1 Tax=Curcuma longa TaxID=136217 RepID=UPI003D9E8C3E
MDLERWLIIHTFYNGINYQTKVYLDSAAGGALMNKSLEEAEEFIESVALNHHQWANERGSAQKIPGKYNVDQFTKLNAQIDALTKKVEGMNVEMCPAVAPQNQIVQYEQCDAVGAFNQRNNPYSNTYNPGWKNHPNFSYRNNNNAYQGGPSNQSFQPKASEEVSDTQKILKILEKLQGDVVKINEKLDDHDKRMKMQETQIAQISSSLSSRTVGTLPGKPEFNPMEHCKAIELRSGRTLKDIEPQVTAPRESTYFTPAAVQPPSSIPHVEDKLEEVETATPAGPSEQKSKVKNVPYPQRLLYKERDEEFEKWYERVKDITMEIPFLDAITDMPKFSKFIKGIISTKDITRPKNVVALTEDVTEKILNNKIPQKLQDPGSFFLPCKIGNISIGRAFCDLGASVSIIPYTTSVKCGYPDLILTPMTLQLADQTCRYPKGLVEDVPVEVGGFTIPTDFVVLDMDEDPSIPIILGRPFLATAGANIDVKNRKLSLEVGGKKITFSLSLDSNAYLPEPPHLCRLETTQPRRSLSSKNYPQICSDLLSYNMSLRMSHLMKRFRRSGESSKGDDSRRRKGKEAVREEAPSRGRSTEKGKRRAAEEVVVDNPHGIIFRNDIQRTRPTDVRILGGGDCIWSLQKLGKCKSLRPDGFKVETSWLPRM